MGVVVVKGPEERERWNDVNAEKKVAIREKRGYQLYLLLEFFQLVLIK